MAEVDVHNLNNEKVGSLSLDEKVFGLPFNEGLIHEAVTMQRACERQGTASTKTRGFVSGGGKKPWKQKGTGRARAGSIRSPIWKGGAVVFGPLPRSYAYAFPKKKGKKSILTLLSDKVRNGRMTVVEELELSEPKTQILLRVLKKLGLDGMTLILSANKSEALERASRNLRRVKLLDIRFLNYYDLIRYDSILIARRDLARLVETWGAVEREADGTA